MFLGYGLDNKISFLNFCDILEFLAYVLVDTELPVAGTVRFFDLEDKRIFKKELQSLKSQIFLLHGLLIRMTSHFQKKCSENFLSKIQSFTLKKVFGFPHH